MLSRKWSGSALSYFDARLCKIHFTFSYIGHDDCSSFKNALTDASCMELAYNGRFNLYVSIRKLIYEENYFIRFSFIVIFYFGR